MESCHSWSYLLDREGPAGVGSLPPPELNSCNIVSTLPCDPPGDTGDPGRLGRTGAESGRAETLSCTSLPNSFFMALFTASPSGPGLRPLPTTLFSNEFRQLQ